MADLQKYKAKVCLTAAGFLIHKDKVLFIKHKKLGIWFCPGGHIDEGELPHQAAEREFWEETGVRVKAVDYLYNCTSKEVEYLPNPVETSLHWVSRENYQSRIKSKNKNKKVKTKLWPKGCEQHLGYLFIVEPIAGVNFKQNIEETDGIGWFSLEEVMELETTDDVRDESKHIFEVVRKYKQDL
jgi:8-oxo-dGTP pyrophosphatase MutT (NUDIX family)